MGQSASATQVPSHSSSACDDSRAHMALPVIESVSGEYSKRSHSQTSNAWAVRRTIRSSVSSRERDDVIETATSWNRARNSSRGMFGAASDIVGRSLIGNSPRWLEERVGMTGDMDDENLANVSISGPEHAPRRLAREEKTIAAMIAMYCRDHHGTVGQPDAAGGLCEECAALLDYARRRLDRCPFGVDKPTCAKCTTHCYKPAMASRCARSCATPDRACSKSTPFLRRPT